MADETVRNYNDPDWRDDEADVEHVEVDDNVQHGIDDNPTGDAEKGAVMGGIGGAVTGAVAGAMTGPGGAVLGAVIGGVAGAVASGAAVGAVDRVDNDDNVTGVGEGVTPEHGTRSTDYRTTSDTWNEPVTRPDFTTAGTTGSRFEDWDQDFRSNWQTNYAASGYYEDYEPAYRYGYDLYSDDRYVDRDWSAFESDARMDWETGRPGTWERFKTAIRYGWERAKAAVSGDDYDATRRAA